MAAHRASQGHKKAMAQTVKAALRPNLRCQIGCSNQSAIPDDGCSRAQATSAEQEIPMTIVTYRVAGVGVRGGGLQPPNHAHLHICAPSALSSP